MKKYRKPKRRAIPYAVVPTVGGPYPGQLLAINSESDSRTAIFRTGKWHGYYEADKSYRGGKYVLGTARWISVT